MEGLEHKEAYHVGIVGKGEVGTKVGKLLMKRDFPLDGYMRVFASERSAGSLIQLGDQVIEVEGAATADYEGLDILFNTAPAGFSKRNAEAIHAQGPVIIDSSSDWRNDPRVPILIPEVNPEALSEMEIGIIAKSNCTTTTGAIALHYLHVEAGLKGLTTSTYQSVSGQGKAGISEHQSQVEAMEGRVDELVNGQTDQYPEPNIFPAVTAFNVAAVAGTFDEDYSDTTEELKFKNEMRKIFKLSPEQLPINVTCARVSTYNCHSLSIVAEFEEAIGPNEAKSILSQAAGVQLHLRADVPQPIYVAGSEYVHVGRIRQIENRDRNGINFWVVADNLLPGAALNAVKIAELMIR
jgi:aspartate-semialdehyde dehydrogenase